MTDLLAATWQRPASVAERVAQGRALRTRVSRRTLADLTAGPGRDPLGILAGQNAMRVQDLVPLRIERMSASPFTFYRGTAAIMAADLARDTSTGVLLPACGDAHVSNFGFYASPQRRLAFDLNDFDESAWAPWEWDLKRLITSVVIAGQATGRDDVVVQDAALAAVRAYARAMATTVVQSPLDRYFAHFDVDVYEAALDKPSRKVLSAAARDARKRTGARAAARATREGADGRREFIENPPVLTHVSAEVDARIHENMTRYARSASQDIRELLRGYEIADVARRVVGVGSVGTRCFLVLLQDGDGNTLLLQAKEAGRSVLCEYGEVAQPAEVSSAIEAGGEGARVVGLQRILQASSDPFLGHLRSVDGTDLYVRQFHDMKGGIDMETLEDAPFARYAQACAAVLARAHAQSSLAPVVAGYLGHGGVVAEALLEWGYAYADLSKADYEAFLAAQAG